MDSVCALFLGHNFVEDRAVDRTGDDRERLLFFLFIIVCCSIFGQLRSVPCVHAVLVIGFKHFIVGQLRSDSCIYAGLVFTLYTALPPPFISFLRRIVYRYVLLQFSIGL